MTELPPQLNRFPLFSTHSGTIADLFHTPNRYYRSVQLERDFHDRRAVQQYVLTPSMRRPFQRILDGLASGATRRAWRITGDYGTGKSSFALVLAHLLQEASRDNVGDLKVALGMDTKQSLPNLLPVLITGSRAPLVPTIAEAVRHALLSSPAGKGNDATNALDVLQRAIDYQDGRALLTGVGLAKDAAVSTGYAGILLVLDELGKFLEFASFNPEQDDVFILQQLGEDAARSGDRPLLLLGLLHQGFQAYAERLDAEARLEWEKVAGRFEEITFDQPLGHTITLVQAALNIDIDQLPEAVRAIGEALIQQSRQAGWLAGAQDVSEVALLGVYPLHPTLLPVLVRFFGRFGQNERSLYNFLLSHDPRALPEFANSGKAVGHWYTIADFYDYVRSAYGHALGGNSYQSHWSRMVDTLDGLAELPNVSLRLLKTIALLNVLDAEHLSATQEVLSIALTTDDTLTDITPALQELRRDGLLFSRGHGGGFLLWPATSVNLDEALKAANDALGEVGEVSRTLRSMLDTRPLLARRHAIETGTLRHFEVRYASMDTLADIAQAPSSADGLVVMVLCDDEKDRAAARLIAQEQLAPLDHVIIGLTPALHSLASELKSVRLWQWVLDHTPDLAHDTYARAEATRQLLNAKSDLSSRVTTSIPLRSSRSDKDVAWFRAGEELRFPGGRGLTALLSDVSDALYPLAPRVQHELLNRQMLSSAGAAARMRLIERMLTKAGEPQLALDDRKTPPERSMYLSVLQRGQLHRVVGGQYVIALPEEDHDPLNLRPALLALLDHLRTRPDIRVSAQSLLDVIQSVPYGTRQGVSVLLLAALISAHGHEIAVYEEGTFVPNVAPDVFLRLSKNPGAFDLQWAAITGVRSVVFDEVARVLPKARQSEERNLLDIIAPLCVFAAQELPEYTRKAKNLSAEATKVRDALLHAQEPSTLLFRQLPEACGLPPFLPDEAPADQSVQAFVSALMRVYHELLSAYEQLMARLQHAITDQLHLGRSLEQEVVAARANAIAFRSQNDLKLRAFALRLADLNLQGNAWLESIASTVIAKPPKKWLAGDEDRFYEELTTLARTFLRVEYIIQDTGGDIRDDAYHVGLTHVNGQARDEIVHLRPDQLENVRSIIDRLSQVLPAGRDVKLAAVSHLLWELLDQKEGAS